MEVTFKSINCPRCNKNTSVIPIYYGKPSPQGIKDAEEGRAKLGGCSPGMEDYHCKDCNFDFAA